jgi:hypothetical protein
MRITAALILVLVSVTGAGASVDLDAHCQGGTITIGVHIFNYEYPPEWVGLVIQRSWNGACGTEEIITDPPLALPPNMEDIYHTVTEPMLEDDHYFAYEAFMVDEDGNLTPAPAGFEVLPYDLAGCGEAVATRGYLLSIYGEFAVCPDLCWLDCYPGGIALWELPPEIYEPYVDSGIPVDVYGEVILDGMPPVPCVLVSDIVPTPGGECGPVPAQRTTWSAIKSWYR